MMKPRTMGIQRRSKKRPRQTPGTQGPGTSSALGGSTNIRSSSEGGAAASSGGYSNSSDSPSSNPSAPASGNTDQDLAASTRLADMPVDPTQWGLDPIYWSHARLLACQIQRGLESVPGIENSHILGAHSLSRVEIVGTIVRVVELERMIKYTLDDSTGLVDCTHWKMRNNQNRWTGTSHTSAHDGAVPSGMSLTTSGDLVPSYTMLEAAASGSVSTSSASSSSDTAPHVSLKSNAFKLGDIVRVRGKLRKVPEQYLHRFLCFSNREVIVSNIAKVRHVHEAILHRLSAMTLYKDFYERTKPEIEIESQPSVASGGV